MNLTKKLLVVVAVSILAAVVISLLVARSTLRDRGVTAAYEKMRAATTQAESVRESVSLLARNHAFDYEYLKAELAEASDYRETTFYGTIPIVAAWKSIEAVAEKEGLDFRVPKERPRNPDNEPTADELSILRHLESTGEEEFFRVDYDLEEIVYAKPIRLDRGCLVCHGDPATSPTGDGLDYLGFEMEGWKEGDLSGAFVLRSNMDSVNEAVRASFVHTLLWILPATAVICVLAYLLVKLRVIDPVVALINTVSEASKRTLAASEEVSNASSTIADGASKQAASLEQTSSTLEEIESMTRKNVEDAESASSIAQLAADSAAEGTRNMTRMMEAMAEIKASSGEIFDIIKTIDEIAFQTNILALNAAVEAARAGESGAGFAVVADEVRSLAQRSAEAARITSDKIANSVGKSEDGARITEEVNVSLKEISSKVNELNEIIRSVKSSSSEQFHGIVQINSAIGEIDTVTQESAAGAEELAGSAAQTGAQAGLLQEVIEQMREQICGKGAASSIQPASAVAHPALGRPKASAARSRVEEAADQGWN